MIAVCSEAGAEQWPSHVDIPPDLQLCVYPPPATTHQSVPFALCFVSAIIFLFSLLAIDFQIDAPSPHLHYRRLRQLETPSNDV